jgi:DNA-binding transcriptional ArsR family regulator
MTKPKRRFVIAHGRRIEVEEVVIPGIGDGKQKPSLGQRFAMLTEERLKLLAMVGSRFPAAWSIYCYLLMVNWKKLRQPVKLTNAVLAELGVSHDAKTRALPQLERVGLVKVKRVGRQAPFVTPLK